MKLHQLLEAVRELHDLSIQGITEAAKAALQCQIQHGCTESVHMAFDSDGTLMRCGFDRLRHDMAFGHTFSVVHKLVPRPRPNRSVHLYFLHAYSGLWAQHIQGLVDGQECLPFWPEPPCYFDSTVGEFRSALDAPASASN